MLAKLKYENPIIGNIKGIEHEIKLKNHTPIQLKPYKIPLALIEDFKNHFNLWVRQGVIRSSNSNYASPSYGISKKNGKIRIVTNYVELNSIKEEQIYQFQDLHRSFQGLKYRVIFSQIDLDSGFNQIAIKEDELYKTAFITELEHYEYCKMPFGMKNAPKSFQRTMEQILEGVRNISIFVDDILIVSKSLEEHIEDVEIVIKRLYEHGAKINYEKSLFCIDEINF